MRPNLPFLSAASNAILKPGGLLKQKKWLVKNIRLSLQLTEVMKIFGLTSLLSEVLRLPSRRPRRRHGRRLALLSPKSNPKSVYYFLRSLAGSSSSSFNLPNCSSPMGSASVFADYLRSHFFRLRAKRPA